MVNEIVKGLKYSVGFFTNLSQVGFGTLEFGNTRTPYIVLCQTFEDSFSAVFFTYVATLKITAGNVVDVRDAEDVAVGVSFEVNVNSFFL